LASSDAKPAQLGVFNHRLKLCFCNTQSSTFLPEPTESGIFTPKDREGVTANRSVACVAASAKHYAARVTWPPHAYIFSQSSFHLIAATGTLLNSSHSFWLVPNNRGESMGHRFVLSLALLLCAEAMLAQVATTSSTSTSTINTSLPVAYVYVSSSHYIHAYKAWANGTYTSVAGSPFPFAGIRKMSVTKNFLFGTDGVNLVSYSIHSNGSISKLSSIKPGIPTKGAVGHLSCCLS